VRTSHRDPHGTISPRVNLNTHTRDSDMAAAEIGRILHEVGTSNHGVATREGVQLLLHGSGRIDEATCVVFGRRGLKQGL
jgi:hypothetical protein